MLVSPLLLLHAGTAHHRAAAPPSGPKHLRGLERVSFSSRPSRAPEATTTTTTTTAPSAASTPGAPDPAVAADTSSAATAPAPTTAALAAPTAVAAAVVVTTSNSTTGQATWYSEAQAGMCASPFLPMGTEVEVVDDATGTSTTCQVDDREATQGRVLDMSLAGFTQLAPATQGVITVTISW